LLTDTGRADRGTDRGGPARGRGDTRGTEGDWGKGGTDWGQRKVGQNEQKPSTINNEIVRQPWTSDEFFSSGGATEMKFHFTSSELRDIFLLQTQ